MVVGTSRDSTGQPLDDDLTLGTGLVTTRIDLKGLQKDLSVFKDRLDAWAENVVGVTERERLQHIQDVKNMTGALLVVGLYVRLSRPFDVHRI